MKRGEVEQAYSMSGKPNADYPMHHYPHYFEPDQLYDLEADPGEQSNVAGEGRHADVLADMQTRLRRYLDRFERPFDLSVDPFLTSEAYRALVRPHLDDDRIYKTYFYLEKAY